MQKSNVLASLASKLRLVKLFNGDKMLLYRRGVLVAVNHDTDGRAIYNKYSRLTTSVWYLSIRNVFCVIQMYFHSLNKIKKITDDIVTGGRLMTS